VHLGAVFEPLGSIERQVSPLAVPWTSPEALESPAPVVSVTVLVPVPAARESMIVAPAASWSVTRRPWS
jgi:hypothetical protein